MPNYLISVNLLLYKPKFYLKPCLESIFAQSYDNFELLIIDNNSGDETLAQVQKIIDGAKTAGQKLPPHKIIAHIKHAEKNPFTFETEKTLLCNSGSHYFGRRMVLLFDYTFPCRYFEAPRKAR